MISGICLLMTGMQLMWNNLHIDIALMPLKAFRNSSFNVIQPKSSSIDTDYVDIYIHCQRILRYK